MALSNRQLQLNDVALLKVISELRVVTCHMGSHNFTCHPTQENSPRPTPARQVTCWYSI